MDTTSECLNKDFTDAGIDKDAKIIVYCQSHQRSAVSYVALKHLGFNNVRAIDGAWSSWGNRDDVPGYRESAWRGQLQVIVIAPARD